MFDKLPISSETERILAKSLDEVITVEEANYLMNVKGSDLYPLLATADFLRSDIVGDDITFINNCNINFTNICTVRCGFCAFGKDRDDPDAYILDDKAILSKAQGAVEKGVHEFCLMGGVLPDADIEYYEHLLSLLKDTYPDVLIHGFSPTMVNDASILSGISIEEAFERLRHRSVLWPPQGAWWRECRRSPPVCPPAAARLPEHRPLRSGRCSSKW